MAKKSLRIEKETRRLMESIGDMVKKRDNKYQFKKRHKKKKQIKKMRLTCVHWIYRKGREIPTVVRDPDHPGYWRCTICGAVFPVNPLKPSEDDRNDFAAPYRREIRKVTGLVNQMQFWAVKLGGDKDDTKMFIELRRQLAQFEKASKNILKNIRKREAMDKNPEKNNIMAAFDPYASYNFRQ